MTITIGNTDYRWITYDREADVLYLSTEDSPPIPARVDATTEGHAVSYDGEGHVIGLTIVNARWLVRRHGEITITPPSLHVSARDLEPALA